MSPIGTDAPRPAGRRPARLPLLVIGISVLLLAACASPAGVSTLNGTEDGSTPEPEASVSPEDAILAFTECMRENGIDLPDPVFFGSGEGGGGGFVERRSGEAGAPEGPQVDLNSEEFQAAQEACREHLEGFEGPGDGPELTEEQQQAFLDFADCMREHGIDMPDPELGGGGFSIQIGEEGSDGGPSLSDPGFDPRSEEFQAAEEACRHFLGDMGPQMETTP